MSTRLIFILVAVAVMGAAGTPVAQPTSLAQPIDLTPTIRAQAPLFSGTVLAAKGNRIVFHKSFGLANRAFDVPNGNDTRYKIASITKLFTAVVVLQLHQEGRLRLEEPIQTYLPGCQPPLGSAMTVHHLLRHTSGMADIVAIKSKEQAIREGIDLYQRPYTAEQIVAKYCAAPARDRPGATFFYNNGDYAVLGRIIETLEHLPFEAVLSRRVLGPLGMTNTGMHQQHRVVPKLADTYFTRDDGADRLANDLPVYTENWYAAGAMYSTAGDLLRFADALFMGRLLEPASLARLMKRGLDDYGYGAWVYEDVVDGRQLTSVMRPGQIMGVNTVLYRVVEPGVTVIVLSNTDKTNVDALAHHLSRQLVR